MLKLWRKREICIRVERLFFLHLVTFGRQKTQEIGEEGEEMEEKQYVASKQKTEGLTLRDRR